MKTTHTQTDGPAIEVRNLRKTYGGVEAVRGVSFEVARGEVFCLLGPNGAGKTSTVEILEGYRTRSGGEAHVLGMDPAHGQRELRERVGIVLQQCGVQNDLTVAELLEMYGRYHPKRRPVGELVELVGRPGPGPLPLSGNRAQPPVVGDAEARRPQPGRGCPHCRGEGLVVARCGQDRGSEGAKSTLERARPPSVGK